jgi:hypothetical protein
MAGPLSERHSPRPATSDVETEYNLWSNVTVSLGVIIGICVVLMPGMLVGAILAWGAWKITRPSWPTIAILSVGFAAGLLIEAPLIPWLWPFGFLFPGRLYDLLPTSSVLPPGTAAWHGMAVELQGGPILLLAAEAFLSVRERTLASGLFTQARERQGSGTSQLGSLLHHYASIVSPVARLMLADADHPPGGIRLGAFRDNRRKAFDLDPSELRLHTFLPGASGSGKTTTLARLADGAMRTGAGLVIIDCKGGGLGGVAEQLARHYRLPFVVVDPDDPGTIGYNPCQGSPSDIANKLIGSFTFGEAGEIYKQVGMHVVPLVVRGIQAAGLPLTLRQLAESCSLNGLRLLTRKVNDEALEDELTAIVDDADAAGKSGIISLQHRFGALLQGAFGPLFSAKKVLDWEEVFSRPSVVYVCLSATAASEDVDLMGRVLIQDLKQACARRLRVVARGGTVAPVLCAIDEFAALDEAKQIIDLLLQARQAAMPLLLATQFLPQDPDLRKAVLQAGLLVVHRLEAADAQDVAAQFGTRPTWKVTHQIDWEAGTTAKGSIRDVEEYVIHPNTLRRLPVGTAAVRSVATDRHALVEVLPPPDQ